MPPTATGYSSARTQPTRSPSPPSDNSGPARRLGANRRRRLRSLHRARLRKDRLQLFAASLRGRPDTDRTYTSAAPARDRQGARAVDEPPAQLPASDTAQHSARAGAQIPEARKPCTRADCLANSSSHEESCCATVVPQSRHSGISEVEGRLAATSTDQRGSLRREAPARKIT